MIKYRVLVTVLIGFVSFTSIFGQSFKIDELEKFNGFDMATFKSEIKKFKYTFYDKTESSEFLLNEYDSPDYQYKIGKFEFKNSPSQSRIEFEFKDKTQYNEYLKAILALGYQQSDSGKIIGGETYVEYRKEKKIIRLVSPKKGLPNEPYTILVFR